jgi:hypothetical protein
MRYRRLSSPAQWHGARRSVIVRELQDSGTALPLKIQAVRECAGYYS